ncbi:growth hormone secretagogue receptor type 1-like [Saccostrea cucullata]|uniref:growth hormone secretagogue receptor type 1-like n=1 Tax=Saccostrea cuccullata TaxID=36930 RepID=UPI002ED2C2FB
MILHHYERDLITYYPYYIHKKLLQIVPPILIIIGTSGNLLSFLVLRKHTVQIPLYLYLCVLSILDLLILYVGLLRLWVGQIWAVDPRNGSRLMCKLVVFIGYVCSDASVWTIVTITAERFFAVCRPLPTKSVLSCTRLTKVWVFAPIVLFSIINSHFFFTVDLRSVQNVSLCYTVDQFDILVNKTWPWVDAALYSFIPTLIIVFLNTKIVQKFLKAKKKRKFLRTHDYLKNDNVRRRRDSVGSRKFTVMLLMVSMTFLVTTLPNNVALIVTAFWNDYGESAENVVIFTLIKTVTELLMYTNHAINFFLYCASGKKFRRHLIGLCTKSEISRRFDSERTPLNTIGSVRDTRINTTELKETVN